MGGKGKWGLGEVGKRWAGTLTASTAQASDVTADLGWRRMSLALIKGIMLVSTYQMLSLHQAPSSKPQIPEMI